MCKHFEIVVELSNLANKFHSRSKKLTHKSLVFMITINIAEKRILLLYIVNCKLLAMPSTFSALNFELCKRFHMMVYISIFIYNHNVFSIFQQQCL
jgi:hypothetical protein